MELYSTKNPDTKVLLKEAVFRGLPPDNGLYMPTHIPTLPSAFFEEMYDMSFEDTAFAVASTLIGNYIPSKDLQTIVRQAVNFPAPIVKLDNQRYILELFHGPSLAFKDFGGRFMAQLMGYFNQGEQKELVILVATSGDTGGAVAAGFHNVPGTQVVILYPSGKVSPLQEKQLTTLGGNITAIEVDGTFDDCQSLVKQAFLDVDCQAAHRLSSANSINISRLIPQSFYYFEAFKQLPRDGRPTWFVVPSGNYGNLTAGLFAYKMGLPIDGFVAASNNNDIVPSYIATGNYIPKPSVPTLSNAMDVGNPSNFARMDNLFSSTWNNFKTMIKGFSVDDPSTEETMKKVLEKYNYLLDPHGAVGYKAMEELFKEVPNAKAVVLETAHPAKFKEDVERIHAKSIDIPERLAILEHREKVSIPMTIDFTSFKEWLVKHKF